MKRFLLAVFLVTALCLSAALCSSASRKPTNSRWVGKHRFTLIDYQHTSIPPAGYGTTVIRHNGHNVFCDANFKGEHHLSLGTVFTGYIKAISYKRESGHACSYFEWEDKHAPIKVVGHVSKVTVRSAIENMPPESALAFAPNEYRLADGAGSYNVQTPISYSNSAAKAVHRAEASGKVVTIRLKITKDGLRHLGFVH